jgi:hypothetical protein
MPNGLELSRPTALGSSLPTVQQHQCAFESPFARAVRVGSIELLGVPTVSRQGGLKCIQPHVTGSHPHFGVGILESA